jgi:hypothetical protein
MNSAHRRADIDFTVAAIVVVFHVYAAAGQDQHAEH